MVNARRVIGGSPCRSDWQRRTPLLQPEPPRADEGAEAGALGGNSETLGYAGCRMGDQNGWQWSIA
jgi:hypothetical protein